MQITKNTLDTNRGPSEWFTGARARVRLSLGAG